MPAQRKYPEELRERREPTVPGGLALVAERRHGGVRAISRAITGTARESLVIGTL